jgi:hypothetical protein
MAAIGFNRNGRTPLGTSTITDVFYNGSFMTLDHFRNLRKIEQEREKNIVDKEVKIDRKKLRKQTQSKHSFKSVDRRNSFFK